MPDLPSSLKATLAGEGFSPNQDLEVLDPATGEAWATVPLADGEAIERATQAASESAEAMKAWPPHRRADFLRAIGSRLKDGKATLAEAIHRESGKPLKLAEGEVDRAVDTFRFAAHAAETLVSGEVMNLDVSPSGGGRLAMTRLVPAGPVAMITPFNFSLNLVAHKIAPAIAAGCPFVCKPADKTPVSALMLGEILREFAGDFDAPPGAFSILPATTEAAAPLVEDDRFKILTFTGSDKVGWQLKAKAGKKKVFLELGGNGYCLVDAGQDLAHVVERITYGAFYQAGQSCISVQCVLCHEADYGELRDRLVKLAKSNDVPVGPMIRPEATEKLKARMDDAVSSGAAALLCGGDLGGVWNTVMQPAVLEMHDLTHPLWTEEAFGPVVLLAKTPSMQAAIEQTNRSRFGLQCGVFTDSRQTMMLAWDRLDVGGVIIGDIPSWRCDPMPYGGVKDSGLGREGPRFAMHDFLESRLMVVPG